MADSHIFSINDQEIASRIRDVIPEVIDIRRTIHQNPELSGSEFETTKFIGEQLTRIGLKPSFHLNNTAVSATLSTGAGKTIVLRADIDALPIQEKTGLPYSSKKADVMHACGHDMHTAILFGAASVLNSLKQRYKGTIVLLFQPSEEVEPGGALGLINAGVFPKNVDGVFGLHVSTDHPTGVIGLKEGIDYAGITCFDITITGRGGHGGTPEKTVDPILCAATIITQLQILISHETSPFTPATLTIGSLHSGSMRNIIPDEASMFGTIRCHSNECMDLLIKRVQEMAQSTAESFNATATLSFDKSYPPGFNDPILLEKFSSAFSSLTSENSVVNRQVPTMYAEDFSYYQQKAAGIYIHLGVKDPQKNTTPYGIHTSQFNPDEKSISTGIASHVAFALAILK